MTSNSAPTLPIGKDHPCAADSSAHLADPAGFASTLVEAVIGWQEKQGNQGLRNGQMNHSQRSIASWTRLHNVPQVFPKHQRNHSSPRVVVFPMVETGNRIASRPIESHRASFPRAGLAFGRLHNHERHPSQKERQDLYWFAPPASTPQRTAPEPEE